MSKNVNLFKYIFLLVNCQLSINNFAQEIPVGTWRTHISFNNIHTISLGSENVYAACENGVVIFDKADNSLSTITKLDGLSSTSITCLAADQSRQQLLIAYTDGDLDIVRSNEIINFSTLKNSPTISGSKKINHISIYGNFAYFSTDYGVVVFDLIKLEIKETLRDLGVAGQQIKIYESTFFSDSIFLATEKGVLAGDLDDNLLDFSNWKRFNTGPFIGGIQSIVTFNNAVYVAVNGSGIHQYENGTWSLQSFLQNLPFKKLVAGPGFLTVTEGTHLWKLNSAEIVTEVASDKITNPALAYEDAQGKLWIGDQRNGLISDKSGSFESYVPNGPSFSGGMRMKYDQTSNKVYAVSGGYSSGSPLMKTEYLNFFLNGRWNQDILSFNQDLTDVEISGGKLFLSSFGKGIQMVANGSAFQDEVTAPKITALASSSSGIWVTNFGAAQSLHLLKNDNTWESFSFAVTASQYPTDVVVDFFGNVWMVINPTNGGGVFVFDKAGNRTAYLTDAVGSGGLPSRSVYSIAVDRDGLVWVGTAAGVAYFPDPSRVFSTGVNAVKPVFENRFLLRDEKVTAIEVDGGNRKWMGTERGVWLFDPFGEAQVYNFNSANSPLLSDKLVDIEVNQQSGEVFFITDGGIVSYRADATLSNGTFQGVKIFPNPVLAHFNGTVSISGLATDATVKITDIAGKLVYQTYANGGTASWNVRDYSGNRASTGMYLVISTTQDGSESVIGKIAVVD